MNHSSKVKDSLGFITPPRTQRTEAEIMASWDNKNEIMVSIHCMAFNHEEFIEDAINGFLIQDTNFAFEVLINDDASTDNTAEIIKTYVEKYPNIIIPIYQKENTYSKGYRTSLFNYLRVKGKYTALCEGDDFWFDKDKLQIQVDFLEKNPKVVMCGHDVTRIAPNTEVTLESELKLSKNKMYSQNRISLGLNLPSKSAMWRSDLPCLGPKMPMGDTFLFSYYGNFGKAYNFKKAMAAYRIHEGGIWSGLTREKQIVDSYSIYQSLAHYSLPKYQSIANLRFLLFLLEYKKILSISDSEIRTIVVIIIKSFNMGSFIYVSNFTIGRMMRSIKRKIRAIPKILGKNI
ncbi:glycosyltransferase [Psychrobacter sp. DAB_AL62B]|uniref:glycosyltransferase n=1 Tax=Psychrobacter sp. DAB_AL62B TaxID=1028420 RepID=UPI0023817EBF|nr:glycosyltransferase [Psychrobacter sp. DAB_AL62B]MDE4453833.1 glycosyltransferase [Psychrobacter sp. DAB_AL62B]